MGYVATEVFPLIGLGVSSIGDSWRSFAQNEKQLETYKARVEKGEIPIMRGHVLNEEDLVIRRHILNLMTRMETHWDQPGLTAEFLAQVPERVQEFIRDGLLIFEHDSCRIPEAGRAFLRNICMAFDARLAKKSPETQLFSQTI